MPKQKPTWSEKLASCKAPEVKVLNITFGGIPEGSRMLIASPKVIDAYVRAVPEGKAVNPTVLRRDLAHGHDADATCPVTTGIFLRIVAEAALEQLAAGKSEDEVTPFWRIVEPKSPLAKKLSCGPEFIQKLREEEGL